jgi:hypothetical protein
MKIVDADVHISARGLEDEITIEQLLGNMSRLGVDRAIAWPMLSYRREVSEDNKAIAAGQKCSPDRIIGFGGLNPMLGKDQTHRELRRCIEEYNFKGFKLNGARDGYYIDDEHLALPVIEEIASRKLVIALHCGANDPVHTHPWRIGNIARRFPSTTILMVHMGGAGIPGLYDAAIRIAKQYSNLYLVGSEADPKAILRAIRELGANRICYGSDCPFSIMKISLATYTALLEDVSEEERKLVMGGNIARLLHLDVQ